MIKSEKIRYMYLFIPIAIYYIFFIFYRYSYNAFTSSINIFQVVVFLAVGILAVSRKKISEEYVVYRNLGCASIIISLVAIIRFILVYAGNYNNDELYFLILAIILCCNILYTAAFHSAYRNNKSGIISIFSIYTIITLLIIFSIKESAVELSVGIYHKKLIMILIGLFFVNVCTFKRSIKEKRAQVLHYTYLIFTLIGSISYVHYKNVSEIFNIFSFNVKYISVVVFYIMIKEEYFLKSYEEGREKLEKATKEDVETNEEFSNKSNELRELHQVIKNNKYRQKESIESVRGSVVVILLDIITYVNNSFRENFGDKLADDIIGSNINDYYTINNNYMDEIFGLTIYEPKEEVCREKAYYKVGNIINLGKEYEVFFIRLSEVDYCIYIKDITYIKESYAIKKQYNEYLKEEREKEKFYANIAHELRTPINVIYSGVQLNDLYIKNKQYDSISGNIKKIKLNSKRLIRTINNFIDANKIMEGYLVPDIRMYNIVPIIEDISIATKEYIEKINNTLTFDSIEEEIYARVDKNLMQRVMLNILSNYVKYGKEGGHLDIRILLEDKKIIIIISSNMYLIHKEDIPNLFNKFGKINNGLDRETEGTGLGLYLSKGFMQLQGGTIVVKSSEEEGTRYILTLDKTDDISEIEDSYDDISEIEDKVETEFSDIYFHKEL